MSDAGDLLEAHAIQALAVETAEAAAEYLHGRLRAEWGFDAAPDAAGTDALRRSDRGQRYSFGYGCCPDMAGQRTLWRLLQPADIDVELTEHCMMDPEASVSALVFSHPEAEYFSVGRHG